MDSSRDQYKKYLRNTLLTSAEAAELLEVSRQRFSALVTDERIEPVLQTGQGKIFLKKDVLSLKRGPVHRNINPMFYSKDGSTGGALLYWNDNKSNLSNVAQIYIYFHELDAMLDGFFIASDFSFGELQHVVSPTMVIRDCKGKEMWFDSLNCGYHGGGPSGSYELLLGLGVSEEMASLVRRHDLDIVKIFKNEDGEFESYYHKSSFTRGPVDNVKAAIRYHKGKIICLQESNLFKMDTNALAVLEEYSAIIPDPKDIILFNSKEQAIEDGFVNINFRGHETVYTLIIRDSSNRELWLCPTHLDFSKPLKYQQDIKQILERCGLQIENSPQKENILKKLGDWLNKKPALIPAEILKVNHY